MNVIRPEECLAMVARVFVGWATEFDGTRDRRRIQRMIVRRWVRQQSAFGFLLLS